jgi:hypothetical protein
MSSLFDDVPESQGQVTALNSEQLDRNTERMFRMGQVISKFASTLALKPIDVQIVRERMGDAPAWSDSETIYFPTHAIGDLTDPEEVTTLRGLGLHESAHIMLTPRDGSNLFKEVNRQKLFRAFNALEDQRIETFMVAMFSNVDDWLIATVAKHLVNEPASYNAMFPLIHGRKYLPKQMRDALRSVYTDQKNVAELAQLIDSYIQLNLSDTSNYPKAIAIIKRYDELVRSLGDDDTDNEWRKGKGWDKVKDPNGHHHRPNVEHKSSPNKPMPKGKQQSIADKVSAQMQGEEVSSSTDYDPLQGSSSNANAHSEITELAQQTLENILHARAKDIRNTIKQFNGDLDLNARNVKPPKRPDWQSQEKPDVESIQASKAFARELALLKAEYEPGWNRKVDQGKLDIGRYTNGVDLEECFDEWDMGREDAVDIECVLLLDNSGSMGRNMRGALQSMWAMKRALDKIGASTTVVTFSDRTELLYSADEQADSKYKYSSMGGSTDPLNGLIYSRSVLANSNRAIKVLIPITDGYWSDSKECDDIIRHLRMSGVITACAMIGAWADAQGNYNIDSHGCEVAVVVNDMSELFRLGKAMVKTGISRNLS